jgi:heat-inducible transcriptional repressor
MQKLDTRKEALLDSLVRQYVRSAEPVGSLLLAEEAGLSVSSATIRNELSELEKGGFLLQPHTSAGRVPTEEAYRYFVEYLISPKPAGKEIAASLALFGAGRAEAKSAAKTLAAETDECVFVAFEPHDVYYTGLSNLFGKPEFGEREIAVNLTGVLDQLDDMVGSIKKIDGVTVLIGSHNPLDKRCSTVYTTAGGHLVGVFGLMRMDYEKILGLFKNINDK